MIRFIYGSLIDVGLPYVIDFMENLQFDGGRRITGKRTKLHNFFSIYLKVLKNLTLAN